VHRPGYRRTAAPLRTPPSQRSDTRRRHQVRQHPDGNIPDGGGGGHRFVGRWQGYQNQLATPGLPKGKDHKPHTGKAFLHTVIDDDYRAADAEIHADEKAGTATRVPQRALAWFKHHGVTVERAQSDNGSCWRDTCAALGITHK
jgi:hypothetical protein